MNSLSKQSNTLFFRAIMANALFSIVCAGLMIVFNRELSTLILPGSAIDLGLLGFLLLLFAAWLLYLTGRNGVSRSDAWAIVIGDVGWVLFTEFSLFYYHAHFSVAGLVLTGLTGLVVSVLAGLQTVSLLKENKPGASALGGSA